MDDLISRKALLEIVGEMPTVWEYGNAVIDIYTIIKGQPAVDAVPGVHGWWQIRESGPGEIECKCSVCKYRDFVPRNDVYWVNRKFCPNCGAKMDGERRDSE